MNTDYIEILKTWIQNPLAKLLIGFIIADAIFGVIWMYIKARNLKKGVSIRDSSRIRSKGVPLRGSILSVENTGRYIGDDPEVKLVVSVTSEKGDTETFETRSVMNAKSPYFTGDKIDVLYNPHIKKGMLHKNIPGSDRKHAK